MEGMNRREPDSGEKAFGTDADATVRAAWLYYHHDLTQAEIAKQLQVSRPTVAVGDISCRYFDLNGQPVSTDFDRRVISLSLDDLRRIKPVIVVAGGEDKVAALLGALRTGCLDILITDERTGRKVLVLDGATRPKSLAVATAKNA